MSFRACVAKQMLEEKDKDDMRSLMCSALRDCVSDDNIFWEDVGCDERDERAAPTTEEAVEAAAADAGPVPAIDAGTCAIE